MTDLTHLKRGSPEHTAHVHAKELAECIRRLVNLGDVASPAMRDVCFAGVLAIAKERQAQVERAAIEGREIPSVIIHTAARTITTPGVL